MFMPLPFPISSAQDEPLSAYPSRPAARDRWVLQHRPLARRPARNPLDPQRPWAFLLEEEPDVTGAIVPVATIFLTNRECPWRCLICDLWRNTLTEPTPPGAIPAQIDYALQELGPARHIKLYNSGSFFDPHAIPPSDYPAIAARVRRFERVIIENHPALINESCLRFRDLIGTDFEIAMGLETADPAVLEKLNKRITLDQFAAAAAFLRSNDIALRVFILVQPPFMDPAESLQWAERSLDFAFACGATAATLIPTRAGNGAIEVLHFAPPPLCILESALDYGVALSQGRVFADTWDLPRPIDCPACGAARAERLRQMNLSQTILPRIACERCGGQS